VGEPAAGHEHVGYAVFQPVLQRHLLLRETQMLFERLQAGSRRRGAWV
jgi:hypothetical protein